MFIISWGGGFLILGPGGFPLKAEEFESLGPLLYLAIFAGPSLAGILLTGVVDGRQGLRGVLTRLRRWRAGWRWYAIALLPALVMTATPLLLSLVSSDFRPAIIDANDKAGIMMRALGPALIAGVFEEIGWTGFAVPHLRSRYSTLRTGLTVGVVWGTWHFPLFWQSDSFSACSCASPPQPACRIPRALLLQPSYDCATHVRKTGRLLQILPADQRDTAPQY